MIAISSSGSLAAATTQVWTGEALFHGVSLTPAAATCTVTVYDGIDTTGTVLAVVNNAANGFTVQGPQLPNAVVANKGIFVSMTGLGATCVVYYSPVSGIPSKPLGG